MSEGTFKNDAGRAEGEEAGGLATGAGPAQSGGEQNHDRGDRTKRGDSDVQDDIEDKAAELKHSSPDQHLGDVMDDVNLEPPAS